MSTLYVNIVSGRPDSYLESNFETAGGSKAIVNRLINYINSVYTGTELAESASAPPSIAFSVQGNMVKASGTITFTGTGAASDTILVNGVTFTAVASGATGNQWNVGASATASAANLAAAINASVTALVSGYVTASSALGVVTVSSAFYGTSGNQCTIAKGVDAGGVMAVSGARLTGGANDSSAQTLSF